jgi:hypothetical protein
MNSRTHTLLTGLGRFVRCLTLVLLPALVAEGGQAGSAYGDPAGSLPESSPDSPYPYSSPYLAVVGPPPMRFREPPAPPSFELEPVAAGPAQLEGNMLVLPAATGGLLDSSQSMAASPKSASKSLSKSPSSSATAKGSEESEPSSILPDDMRREVRPEDLLPFFQYPRNGGAVIGVPVPAQPALPTLPPSSATYRQQ